MKITKGISEKVYQERVLIEVQALDNLMLNMYKHIQAAVKVLLVVQWLDHMEAASNSTMVEELKRLLEDNLILALNLLEDLNLLEANN